MICSWMVGHRSVRCSDSADVTALGIHDEVDALEMKGNKKKKSRKLDEDFIVRFYLDSAVRRADQVACASTHAGRGGAEGFHRHAAKHGEPEDDVPASGANTGTDGPPSPPVGLLTLCR